MDLYDILFLIQFLAIFAILAAKFYNITTFGKFYNLAISFLLFMGFFIFWGVGMVITLIYPTDLIFLQLWRFESWFIVFNVIFLFAELLFNWQETAVKPIEAYNSLENSQKQLKSFTSKQLGNTRLP